ncbi:MAG: HAMP domain-containing sensor histidine kinase [Myxococcota bacterium]
MLEKRSPTGDHRARPRRGESTDDARLQGVLALVRAWSHPVIHADRAGVVTSGNPAAERLGLVGRKLADLLRGSGWEPGLLAVTGDAQPRVVVVEASGGRQRWLLCPTPDGITLAMEAPAATGRTDEATTLRSLLLTVLGHDLRNPVAAIRMAADYLVRSGTVTDRQAKALARIAGSADRLTTMLDQLLDFTRIQLGEGLPITPVPMDLHALCHQVREEIEVSHPERRVMHRSSGDGRGQWDLLRLSQVVQALVGNALVHGAPDKPVVMSSLDDGDHVVVQLQNEGPPIAPDVLPHLLEASADVLRARSIRRGDGNLGLGLYLANQVILTHGGRMEVRSTTSEGTTVTLRLPRQPPSPPR